MWSFGKRNALDPHNLKELLEQRLVRLIGEINDDTAQIAIAQLLFLEYHDVRQPITLCVESPGGSVAAGMAVVNTVRGLCPPVRTRVLTLAHGIALFVLASGRKGERTVGSAAELCLMPIEKVAGSSADTVRLQHQLAGVIAELCGKDLEAVVTQLFVKRLLTPGEAVACGLADRVEA